MWNAWKCKGDKHISRNDDLWQNEIHESGKMWKVYVEKRLTGFIQTPMYENDW